MEEVLGSDVIHSDDTRMPETRPYFREKTNDRARYSDNTRPGTETRSISAHSKAYHGIGVVIAFVTPPHADNF
jgi:hypothetical protein